MEEALMQVGLPVQCARSDCDTKGFVKPQTDYGGWYKSKLFRFRPRLMWYCPKHHNYGQIRDKHFYDRYKTPDPAEKPETVETIEQTTEDLYKLLD